MTDENDSADVDIASAAAVQGSVERAMATLDGWEDGDEPVKAAEPAAEEAKPAESEKPAKDDAKAKAEPEGKENKADDAKPDGERERNPDGTFKAKDGEKAPDKPKEGEEGKEPEAKADDKPKVETKFPEPPKRFAETDAKEAWKDTPEPVRAEIDRAFKNLEAGIEKNREDASKFDELRDLDAHVRKYGSNIKDALTMYLHAENVLRTDPERGLQELFRNLGLNPTEWANKFLGQEPDQKRVQDERTINQLLSKINNLEQQIGGVTQTIQTQHQTTVERSITEFAAQNPRFNELADEIANMLETGYATNLQDAYDKADRLKPAPDKPASSAAQPASSAVQQPDPAVQTDKASKSISGAPTSGSSPDARRRSSSIAEALQRAGAQTGAW